MATQLRRYEIEDGGLDRMVEWFPNLIPAREKFGFTINFAYADRDTNEFIWSVSHPDFEAAEKDYRESPERTAAFVGFDSPVVKMHVAMIDEVV